MYIFLILFLHELSLFLQTNFFFKLVNAVSFLTTLSYAQDPSTVLTIAQAKLFMKIGYAVYSGIEVLQDDGNSITNLLIDCGALFLAKLNSTI